MGFAHLRIFWNRETANRQISRMVDAAVGSFGLNPKLVEVWPSLPAGFANYLAGIQRCAISGTIFHFLLTGSSRISGRDYLRLCHHVYGHSEGTPKQFVTLFSYRFSKKIETCDSHELRNCCYDFFSVLVLIGGGFSQTCRFSIPQLLR